VAHDFNNILSSLLMQTDLIGLRADLPGEVRQDLHEIRRDVNRAAELTRQLLLFGRRQVMQPRLLNLNDLVINFGKMLQRIIREDVHLHLHLHPAALVARADPGMLEQVLMNLAVNARDAMPGGGQLHVATTETTVDEDAAQFNPDASPGRYVGFSVGDTGSGIPPEAMPRIFEPFFTTKEVGKGTGLGLSMVYGFVKQSNGGIRIYSEPGYGTTITFYLPFSGTPAALPPPKAAEDGAIRGSGVVLIVDDEAELVEIAVTYLSARGYTVLTARDAKDALRIIEQHGAVDAMITDIVMGGGMDGMELAQAVRRISPRTQVVYSSGFPADALSERSLPLAGSLVLQKPYRLAELGASVVHVLSSA
jgi:CheY-like chemotaxis protein